MPSLRAFGVDRRATTAVPIALAMTTLVGFAALAVDVGSFYYERGRLQNAADLAALAAAADLAHAGAAASGTVRQNGYADATVAGVELGLYRADPSLAPGARFAPAGSAANAARVTLATTVPTFFGRALGGTENVPVRAGATGARSAFTSFAIGSRLLAVNGGLLNGILSGLLGTSVSLSALDYSALVSSQVDLFAFSNALASRTNVTAATYSQLLAGRARVGDILAAMADASRAGSSQAGRALDELARGQATNPATLPLAALADLGPYEGLGLGTSPSAGTGASVSAFDLLSAVAQAANGSRQVEIAISSGLPAGLGSATLRLAIGERPAGTSWMTVGPEGATVTTAQARLLLTVGLLASGSTPVLSVPLSLELAPARATLKAMQCGYPDAQASSVTLAVRPGVLDSWIGTVPTSDFYNLRQPLSPAPAALVSVPPAIEVTGLSRVAITNLAERDLSYSSAEITAQTRKRTATQDVLSSTLSQLLSGTRLEARVAGLSLSLPGTLTPAVSASLSASAQPIGQLASTILAALGIGLGQADTWVTGIRCDGAVLVD